MDMVGEGIEIVVIVADAGIYTIVDISRCWYVWWSDWHWWMVMRILGTTKEDKLVLILMVLGYL